MPPPQRSSLRTSALLAAGALSLHELRFLIGWGAGAERALAGQGHAYLDYAMPVAVGLVAAGLAQALRRLGRARRGSGGASGSWVGAWLVASAALLAIYTTQETVEGLLALGHPGGLAGVFGHGGLVAGPLALALGGVIALAERSAREGVAGPSRLAVPVARILRPGPARRVTAAPRRHPGATAGELALHLAGRAPPVALR